MDTLTSVAPYYSLERYAKKAIEQSGLIGWSPWEFSVATFNGVRGVNCYGAVCGLKEDGSPDWNKPKRGTYKTIFVSNASVPPIITISDIVLC